MIRRLSRFLWIGLLVLPTLAAGEPETSVGSPWPVTGGDPGGMRYSPLDQIDRSNVGRLEPLWTYRHGDVHDGGWLPDRVFKGTAFESTPLVVEERLVFTTPYNRVIALDPVTGEELWVYDPEIDRNRRFANMLINRGVAYWRAPLDDGPCSSRVFLATLDARLIALDPGTGRPCRDFGAAGTVDLTRDVGPLADPWEYNVTSPPTVLGDVVVVGSSIADLTRRLQPRGDVRAFHARTGKLLWRFHTIPRRDEHGTDTWEDESWRRHGGANVWSTITADPERGLLFLPVSTVGPDFYGVDRPGANFFSDSLVALDVKTGQRTWHFQTVHHGLWDYDLAAPPNLVTVHQDGRAIDAVAQATKTGLIFLFERETGRPLFPVRERPVPQSDVPGEKSWPTQPFPDEPPPLVPHRLTEGTLWKHHPSLDECKSWLAGLRNDGIFTPPSLEGSILYPFTGGGANWSGAAFDPERRLLYVPVQNLAHVIRLAPLPPSNYENTGGFAMRGLSGLWWLLTGRGTGLRYWMDRKLFAVDDVPCNAPPWGRLAAVDLDDGSIRWTAPIGETELAGTTVRGLPNFGPPLVTAGGLVFHAGTRVSRLRAHDADTGEVLATFPLPAGLHAGPVTYDAGGRQILVVAPGGHVGLGSELGDWVIAYALP